VNNPSIWRPILDMRDAGSAYIRAIEASYDISGIFNISSGNYTVGEIADVVQDQVEKLLGVRAKIRIKHMKDFRNYKVSNEKARNVLSFKPNNGVDAIIRDLAENLDKFKDFDNAKYYNIKVFKALEYQNIVPMKRLSSA